jgi:hypothetical protein
MEKKKQEMIIPTVTCYETAVASNFAVSSEAVLEIISAVAKGSNCMTAADLSISSYRDCVFTPIKNVLFRD